MMAETEQQQPLKRVDPHHGNNVAAWTAVAIMLVGSIVAALGVGMGSTVVFVVGMVVVVGGAVTGKILAGMGMGAYGKHH